MDSTQKLPWRLALALVLVESLLAALGAPLAPLALAALGLAPGLALLPLLPARAREDALVALAAAPALGMGAASVLLVSVAAVGIPLTGVSVRAALAALVLCALPLWRRAHPLAAPPAPAALALAAAVAGTLVVQARVLGELPVPGNDWAKYVLYADEIRREGALLIDNPYWMLGVPFREDPGAPALYGAFLELTGAPAAAVAQGIWALAAAQVLAVFALVASLAPRRAGVLAAALYGLLPLNLNLLGWHGVANALALALAPLALLYAAALIAPAPGGGFRRADAAGFALVLVALAAAHRLSFAVALAALGIALCSALLSRVRRAAVVRGAAWSAALALALAPAVAYDLVERSRTFGGTQGYEAYADTRLDLGLLVRDLTLPFAVVAAVSVLLSLREVRRRPELVPLLATAATAVALACSWVVRLPLHYTRMAYYLPLALCPLVAVALARHLPRRAFAVAGALLAVAVAASAWPSARNVRSFYAFANPASLRGLDAVAATLRPGEVVVTDRCWSFLGTWLVHAPTLAALEPSDIQPKAEVVRARQARSVLDGTPAGRALARRLRVRYLLVDPLCPDVRGRFRRPPPVGTPAFVSERLVVLELGDSRLGPLPSYSDRQGFASGGTPR